MRRLISSINVTLDGFCDHTAEIADDELHQNATDLIKSTDTMLLGRKTYELMEAGWAPLVKNPSGNKPMDDFALAIENIDKIVFSRTLKTVGWKNARLATADLADEVSRLKAQPGKDIGVGGPTLIMELLNLGLIDEYQFHVQPIILGSGLPLFKEVEQRTDLKLLDVKSHASGVVTLRYKNKPGLVDF